MRMDRSIWDKHGWRSADDVNYTTYRKEVNERILKKYNVSKRDLDALTFENHHSLRHVIEKNKTKTRTKKTKTRTKKTTTNKKPRISAKRKKQIKTTSAVIGKRAWEFLTTEPKKKKSAFDFFNV